MSKLDREQIQQGLSQGQAFIFDEINSTNTYLLDHYKECEQGSICAAETQTAARGRRGRKWHAPKNENLYFSLYWRYDLDQNLQFQPLSLISALMIVETLTELGVKDLNIKWPNDVYHQGKKMSGILIETAVHNNQIHFIIGIGLNLASMENKDHEITQPWSDLSSYHLNRNPLLISLTNKLQQALQNFPQTGFKPYLEVWKSLDIFYQKEVKLLMDSGDITGISKGINEQGELLLQQKNGEITPFAIGEISVRAI